MNSSRLERLAPLTGLVFVALLVVGFFLTGTTDYNPTKERAVEIFSTNPALVQRGTLLGGFYGSVFLVWFVGVLFSSLRSKSDSKNYLAAVTFGGGLIIAISVTLGMAVIRIASVRAGRPGGITGETAIIFYDLYSTIMAGVVSSGLAILIGGAGIASLRIKLFPIWFSWASIIVAVGLLSPLHYIFEAVSLIWIIVVSILLFLLGRHSNELPTTVRA